MQLCSIHVVRTIVNIYFSRCFSMSNNQNINSIIASCVCLLKAVVETLISPLPPSLFGSVGLLCNVFLNQCQNSIICHKTHHSLTIQLFRQSYVYSFVKVMIRRIWKPYQRYSGGAAIATLHTSLIRLSTAERLPRLAFRLNDWFYGCPP